MMPINDFSFFFLSFKHNQPSPQNSVPPLPPVNRPPSHRSWRACSAPRCNSRKGGLKTNICYARFFKILLNLSKFSKIQFLHSKGIRKRVCIVFRLFVVFYNQSQTFFICPKLLQSACRFRL